APRRSRRRGLHPGVDVRDVLPCRTRQSGLNVGPLGLPGMSLAASLSDAFASRPDPDAVPAGSVAVAVDEQEVTVAWGVGTSTLFQAASISKPVAAMTTLRLVADDCLRLDADVNKVLTS